MAFLIWSPKYEVGIRELDEQHKHCVELLNNLCNSLLEKNMKLHLVSLLYEAIEYTNYHFSEEERLMQNIGYPLLADQKKLHMEMSKRFEDLRGRIVRDEPVVPDLLVKEMKRWFKTHIITENRKFTEMYKQKMDPVTKIM
jgi:hemerythrin